VDVRDVALAQVLAYENPKSSGQRYLITAEPFAWEEVKLFNYFNYPSPAFVCPFFE
jgi:nucleoside-diphosphate-sugar epimerase